MVNAHKFLCASCKWWLAERYHGGANKDDDPNGADGRCHLNPPSSLDLVASNRFPRVTSDMYCGQHQAQSYGQ